MPQFVLMLHEAPTTSFNALSPADMQATLEQYRAWSGKLAQAGKLKGGNKLTDEGGRRVAVVDGKVTVTDGPYAEAKDVIGGYFVIEAADYAEAAALCDDHPHLRFGPIDIRRVDTLDGAME